MPPDAPEISVVVPVFNERENIPPLVEALDRALAAAGAPFEMIFVDDGSTDGSFEALLEARRGRPGFRILRFRRNAGQSAAFDAGFRAARGRAVVTLDADLQNDPADIPLVLAPLAEFDVVCGWRQKRRDNFVRRASSRIANWVRNRLSGETVIDTGCSLKAFRAEVLRRIKMYNGMHRFLPTLAKLEGFTVAQVPVGHHPRTRGVSKYNVWNRVFRSFRDLLAVRWMKARRLEYDIEREV